MIRVVITGIGAVTPLGNSFPDSWNAVKAGCSGIRQTTKVFRARLKWKAAGELKNFQAEKYLGLKEVLRLDPFVHYAVASAVMSAEDAGLLQKPEYRSRKSEEKKRGKTDPHYFSSGGVIIGSSRGGISSLENACMKMHIAGLERSRLSNIVLSDARYNDQYGSLLCRPKTWEQRLLSQSVKRLCLRLECDRRSLPAAEDRVQGTGHSRRHRRSALQIMLSKDMGGQVRCLRLILPLQADRSTDIGTDLSFRREPARSYWRTSRAP